MFKNVKIMLPFHLQIIWYNNNFPYLRLPDWIVLPCLTTCSLSWNVYQFRTGVAQAIQWLNDRQQRFDYHHLKRCFLFTSTYRHALGSIQSPIQWVLGPFPRKKVSRDVKLTTLSSAEIRMRGAKSPFHHTSSGHGA